MSSRRSAGLPTLSLGSIGIGHTIVKLVAFRVIEKVLLTRKVGLIPHRLLEWGVSGLWDVLGRR